MGDVVVNRQSGSLYEDSPLPFLSPEQMMSRVHLEHNYSYDESAGPVDEECTSNSELADDLVNFQAFKNITIKLVSNRYYFLMYYFDFRKSLSEKQSYHGRTTTYDIA